MLLNKNATVYIGSWSAHKAAEAVEKLKNSTGNDKVHVLQTDSSDLFIIRKAVEGSMSRDNKLHVLI